VQDHGVRNIRHKQLIQGQHLIAASVPSSSLSTQQMQQQQHYIATAAAAIIST